MIYLDHNATAPVKPAVIEAMAAALRDCGNASSIHGAGRKARRQIEEARDDLAAFIGLPAIGTIVFTSGGTEANQLALRGCRCDAVFASDIEHDSVMAIPGVVSIPVTPQGVADLAILEGMMAEAGARGQRVLVSIMAANNETGIIQPIQAAAQIVHAHGGLIHCDAVQAIGRIGFNMTVTGADMVSVSAHKLGGPQGVGALAMVPGIEVSARQIGGGQERGFRAGTENVAGIAGFAEAIRALREDSISWRRIEALRDRFEAELEKNVVGSRVFGTDVPRLPNTSCVAMPGVSAETQVIALDLAGIAVSAGAACSSGKLRPSHVLQAMGVDTELARCAIRVSLTQDTTGRDIDAIVAAWLSLAKRHAGRHAA